MWPFSRMSEAKSEIKAHSIIMRDGVVTIDVRGQTCPGYLLAINKAVDPLPTGTVVSLITTYSPCGDDLEAYCKAKEIEYLGASQSDGAWAIKIRK